MNGRIIRDVSLGYKPVNSNYLDNYLINYLYCKEFKENKGKYMTVVFEDNSVIDISSKIAVRITHLTKENKIEGLKLTKLTNGVDDGEMILSKFDIEHLNKFLELIKSLNLKELSQTKIKLLDNYELNEASRESLTTILSNPQGEKFIKAFVENGNVTSEDIVNIGYRKQQLDVFEKMLKSKDELTEPVWQSYFEKNKWIFGYGLDFVFKESLLDRKLEQYTSGSDFIDAGFEVDALLKSMGAINNICFCEIKKPSTKLLSPTPKRSDVWHIHSNLYEAISQLQKNAFRMKQKFQSEIKVIKKNGDPTGEVIYLIKPKMYLIVGSLTEFNTEYGINEHKLSSFELFRNNLKSPEIITFDELFERAKHIVQNTQLNVEELKNTINDENVEF